MIRIAKGPHLDDESRAMLASGRANAAFALFIDTLVELRGLNERAGEVAAGAMLEAETPFAMAADALNRVLAAIEKAGPLAKAEITYPELIRLPQPLVEEMRGAEAREGWKALGGGISQLALCRENGVEAEILRIPAGVATPRHTHKGEEYTLCLIGGFSDEFGQYGPGDVTLRDPSITHQPIADDDGVCYVLAVTQGGGIKLKGMMGVVQKLMGK